MGSVVYKRDYQVKALKDPKFKAQEKKRRLMTEDDRLKTALAQTDIVRLTLHTIERLKMVGGNRADSWDEVTNRVLDVYYEEKKKRGN